MVSKRISDSVSKKFGIEKSIRFGIGKIWYKKVSDSVSKKIGIEKSIRFGIIRIYSFGNGCVQLLGNLGGVSVSKLLDIKTCPFLDSIGFGIRVSEYQSIRDFRTPCVLDAEKVKI